MVNGTPDSDGNFVPISYCRSPKHKNISDDDLPYRFHYYDPHQILTDVLEKFNDIDKKITITPLCNGRCSSKRPGTVRFLIELDTPYGQIERHLTHIIHVKSGRHKSRAKLEKSEGIKRKATAPEEDSLPFVKQSPPVYHPIQYYQLQQIHQHIDLEQYQQKFLEHQLQVKAEKQQQQEEKQKEDSKKIVKKVRKTSKIKNKKNKSKAKVKKKQQSSSIGSQKSPIANNNNSSNNNSISNSNSNSNNSTTQGKSDAIGPPYSSSNFVQGMESGTMSDFLMELYGLGLIDDFLENSVESKRKNHHLLIHDHSSLHEHVLQAGRTLLKSSTSSSSSSQPMDFNNYFINNNSHENVPYFFYDDEFEMRLNSHK